MEASEKIEEAEEVEVFPTEARMRQKANEKRILEETGEIISQRRESRPYILDEMIVEKAPHHWIRKLAIQRPSRSWIIFTPQKNDRSFMSN